MEPKFHFPKRTLILIKRPHHDAEVKPDTDEFAATAAAAPVSWVDEDCLSLNEGCVTWLRGLESLKRVLRAVEEGH